MATSFALATGLNDLFILGVAFAVCAALTIGYVSALSSRKIYEVPNERSMHKKPVLTGSGWAILATVLVMWPALHWPLDDRNVALLLCMLVLAIVSWLDDLEKLPWQPRLLAHAGAVAICLVVLPIDMTVLGGVLPVYVERVVIGFGWLWFINLYNFMDGIDGITGVETASVCLGYVLVGWMAGFGGELIGLALVLTGASIAYLCWNWHPSRIMLGDVGSIPLGLMVGALMVDLAMRGHIASSIILTLYYLSDATITLLSRILRGAAFLKPHREHFYQRAVLGRLTHDGAAMRICLGNVVLILMALIAVKWPVPALAGAAIVVGGLLVHFQSQSTSKAL